MLRPLSAFGVVMLIASSAFAAPHVSEEISQAMQDRDYAAAIEAIDAALATAEAPDDYLTYLKGRAHHYLEQYEQAIRVFDAFDKQFPDSPWARQVRFAKAVSLTRINQFEQSEAIYRAEAEYLLSADRKQELANIYLEYANVYFEPKDRQKQPDYAKALEFFQKALEIGPQPKSRVEVELLVARCYQAMDNFDEATNRFSAFIDQHPDSDWDIEARFRLGDSRLKQGNRTEARRAWQDLLAKHATADSERIAEARFRLAETYQMPNPPTREDLSFGVAALQDFLTVYPDHKLASKAHLDIARGYQSQNRFEDAAKTLHDYLDDSRYAESEETPDARYLLGECYQLQRNFDKALTTWKDYLAKHPAHKRWSEAQRQIVDTEYLMAAEQQEAKKYGEARNLWTVFLANYPLDARAAQTLYVLGDMNFAQEKWQAAIDDWRRLVSKYPNTDPASQAQFMIGQTLEEKLGEFEQAIEQYKKTTWGSHQQAAAARIVRLTAKRMTVRTERVFRSDEQPSIQLVTRNIEKVTVSAYVIDLETYFRKMHLATGIESLDIALIDPTRTFEFDVPDYEKYKEVESHIPLSPSSDESANTGGVFVATVSSDTLEATTMVLQSDLEMIVKSSRDEVFVFSQNMRTGEPWPGVKLLVSDGAKVFSEAKTNADGVFQKSFEELKSANDVRVFAIDETHTASNVVGLKGLNVARGLSSRGYIYTDRPTYRPGQLVNVRGVVRRVADDTYRVDAGKKYQLSIHDTRNRLVFEDEVELSEFGGFHCNFSLPPSSPQGTYRILVSDKDKQQYQGQFSVQQYKLESVELAIDSDRQVYYRGEEIKGTISVKYYYGAPLVGREVRYRLGDGRIHTARTNDQGEIAFALPTRDLRETQVLGLLAEMPEYNLTTARQFVLAAQEFSLAVTTSRPFYLVGESFEAIIKALDAEGKPADEQLTLSVLERTDVNGRTGERLVEQKKIRTDKDRGEARIALNLKKGASYILRAEGQDRFDNPITGQQTVTISGDDDTVRLRILASQHTYRAGDEAVIKVHWRESPALALVTFQGARVLHYRLEQLQQGMNTLRAPMNPDLAPNFDLSIAVMIDPPKSRPEAELAWQRFHSAASSFTVQRDLLVKLETIGVGEGETVRPGAPMKVRVVTTDPQGNPVDAEVSLAMVEQALLDRFPSGVPSITDFFRGETRQSAVRTDSSITFLYQPPTEKINVRLLAEAARLEIEEEERLGLEAFDTAGLVGSLALPEVGAEHEDAARNYSWGMVGARPMPSPSGNRDGFFYDSRAPQSVRQFLSRDSQRDRGSRSTGAFDDRYAVDFDFEVSESQLFGGYAGGKGVMKYADGLLVLSGRQQDLGAVRARLDAMKQEGQSTGVTALLNNGAVVFYNLADLQGQSGDVLLKQLRDAEATLIPGLPARETGYWNPAIRTGESGETIVQWTMPDRSTAWRLLAKGVTLDTLAGESEAKIVAEKDLFGELKLPLAFVDGDSARIQATIHHAKIKDGKITATLKTTIGGKTSQQTRTIDAAQSAQHDVSFETTLRRPDQVAQGTDVGVTFELVVTSGEQEDHVFRAVALEPYGYPVFGAASGVASSDATAWVELPDSLPASGTSLHIVVGPTVEQGLMDVLFGPTLRCQIINNRFTASSDASASDLMAGIALQQLLAKSRTADTPQAAALDQRIRAAVGNLVSSQRDDGGWSWTERGGASDRFVSARAMWALTLAAKAGYPVPEETQNLAVTYLRDQAAKTDNADYESKAILLHALTVAGHSDFPLANRLYRSRPALSLSALLHLTLAFAEMDRSPMAEDVLRVASERSLELSEPRRKSSQSSLPWSHSPTELRALYALALDAVRPRDPKLATLTDWLLKNRVGTRWSPDKATGPATLALCRWQSVSRKLDEHYKLDVLVNGQLVKQLEFSGESASETIVAPAESLRQGKQHVQFRLNGRARFSYQCVMEGFVAAEQLKTVSDDWRIERYYEAAQLELDGKTVPRGFDVLRGSYQSFRNPLTQLPVGRRGHVTLRVWRNGVPSDTPLEHLEYLVVTEPIPCGATVVEDSISGGYEWFDLSPGAITFYVGNRQHISTISYDIHGFLPGEYRAAPPMIRDAYRPEHFAVHSSAALKILPLGAVSEDPYRMTPRELYEVGKWRFERQEMEQAAEHLGDLVENWNLKDDIYQDATRMLLDAHLEIGPPRQVVHHFEVIKERWPEMEIPYGKILRIGAAYHDMGEYERAYLIFRATVESSFLTESQVAGFLQSQQELLRSVQAMDNLLREYPPEPYVANATFDLAQQVYGIAPQAKTDEKLREAKITRVDLIRRALSMLDGFVTAYPEDPGADQAAFSMAAALLELQQHEAAEQNCRKYVQRYPTSDNLDAFWYTIGYCHFALGQHEQALEVCRKVAEMKLLDKATGKTIEAENRNRAIYIMGQIFHSLGDAAKAIQEYARVEDRFADAKEAIQYFTRRHIQLPEVTTALPGEPVEVKLEFRNLAECETKVYRIDLMKFSLLKRDLRGITNINLAGIRPQYETTVKLGDGKDYVDRENLLELPLEKEGAYLVVCRGDDLHTTGLVLITPLAVETQEDAASGRIRATVRNTVQDGYVPKVHVKVIGSGNEDFVSGETDLRGVFVADGIQGVSTVIALADGGRYAFHRGSQSLGASQVVESLNGQAEQQQAREQAAAEEAPPSDQLLQGLYLRNSAIQGDNFRRQREQYFNDKAGVTVEAVK